MHANALEINAEIFENIFNGRKNVLKQKREKNSQTFAKLFLFVFDVIVTVFVFFSLNSMTAWEKWNAPSNKKQ